MEIQTQMSYAQLLDWVNNPVRTQAELQEACTGIGLAITGTADQLRRRLRTRIAAMPNLGAPSPWTPQGWTAPPPTPTPVPGPVPAPPTPPGQGPVPAPAPATAPAPLAILTPGTLPPAIVGTAYNQVLNATGGTAPYAWTLTGNPAWLTLTGNALTGTPTAPAGTINFLATVADANGATNARVFTLQVNPATPALTPAIAALGPMATWLPWVLLGGVILLLLLVLLTRTIGEGINPPATPAPVPTQVSVPPTASWPTNPREAASTFGGDASRWEVTADGGWHLREEGFTTLVNPSGFLGEGYYDTHPGTDPQCFAFTIPVGLQGATIWQESGTKENAERLLPKMAIPVWTDGKQHPCRVLTAP